MENHRQIEGIWQFESEEPVSEDNGKLVNDTFTFVYEDGTVTMRLLTLRPGQWKSDDDFYKLQARWQGDALYYLPPFGKWTELAMVEGDRFVNIGNGKKRIFAKVPGSEVVSWNRGILKPGRALHDYRIQPDGSLKTQNGAA
jgi:hypothetical protein